MKKILFIGLIVLSVIGMAMTPQNEKTSEKMYTVDFNGKNFAFKDLKTGAEPTGLYAAGDTVLLSFEMQATDVSYRFFLDGEEINASYFNEQYGFCYHFIMPAHDVKFTWQSRNLMTDEDWK